jgi:hypothetical protein
VLSGATAELVQLRDGSNYAGLTVNRTATPAALTGTVERGLL